MRQASSTGGPARQTSALGGIVFIEKRHSAISARNAKHDCGMLHYWTLKAFSQHWQKLHETLERSDGTGPMLALLGPLPDEKKLRFIDKTLERQSGDLVAQHKGKGGEAAALYIRKLVFALTYLGKLCRLASEGNAEDYVKFAYQKIIGTDGKGKNAAGKMLLGTRSFDFALKLAEGMADADAPEPFPAGPARKIAPAPLATQPGFHIKLPENMRAEREVKRKAAAAVCLGMAKIKFATLVLELRQAAIYTLETGGNASGTPNEKNKSQLTLDAIDGSDLQGLLRAVDRWKLAGFRPSLENALKFGRIVEAAASEAGALAEKLHKITGGKLARKMSYLASVLSLLEKDDAKGALYFWDETLRSKIKERADGVETGLAAKSLLEDPPLSLAFGKLRETSRYS